MDGLEAKPEFSEKISAVGISSFWEHQITGDFKNSSSVFWPEQFSVQVALVGRNKRSTLRRMIMFIWRNARCAYCTLHGLYFLDAC